MNFRARVTIGVAAAVATAVLLASAAAYFLARHTLYDQVDATLNRAAAESSLFASQRIDQIINRPSPRTVIRSEQRYIQLVDESGRHHPPRQPALPVDREDVDVATGRRGKLMRDATAADGAHVRLLTFPIGGRRAVQIARPLSEVDGTLSSLRLALVLVGLLGIGLAAGLGFIVARATLAPVRRLTGAAEHIATTQDLGPPIEVRRRDELGRLATTFNEMLAALEVSRAQQQQLVADASHELRTPLTALRTNIEVLARDISMPEAERNKLLADVTDQVDELSVLVGDLVELAREDSRRTEEDMVELRLDELARRAVTRARLHAPTLRFTTALEPCTVRGSQGLLERAFANLLDNACKWSPPYGTVRVDVYRGEMTVRDYGPGISPEELERVFDRFYRAPTARSKPGSGLGLAIVRRVAEAHGATVTAQQAPGGGTVMRFRLRAVAPDGEPTES
jgi:two-component system sensor histidine kinase MprB